MSDRMLESNFHVEKGQLSMFTMLQALGRGVIKVLISLVAGGGVGVLSIGVLATMNPDLWEYHVLDRHGPPFGPTLVSVGAAMLTTAVTLCALFFPTWWRSGSIGQWIHADEPPPLPR